ncbi:MAG TPA: GMP synthase [Desulfocapsa sulfexigens]|nr:GMP synthase [Desulfocapsa sulfexigens]
MKAAILQCDDILEKFQPLFDHYPKMIEHMFDGVATTPISFDTYDCRQCQFPDDINKYDFYLTTGSRSSVYEDQEWIHQMISFVQQLDKQKKKLIGICFGHQLMAMARGRRVEKSKNGWGIGVAKNRVIAHPEWMTEKPSEINILTSHQDQITELPDDTLVIAESDFCPFFIVQWGNHFLSIQGHPEWNAEYSKMLINDRRAIIPEARVSTGLDSLDIKLDNALFVDWILKFV